MNLELSIEGFELKLDNGDMPMCEIALPESKIAIFVEGQDVDMEIVDHGIQSTSKPEEAEESIAEKYTESGLLEISIIKMVIPILKLVRNMEELINYVKGYVSDDVFEVLEFCVSSFPVEEIKECFSQELLSVTDRFTE